MNNHGWRKLWANKTDRIVAVVSTLMAVLLVVIASEFLLQVEHRSGVVIADPIQAQFSAIDFTWPIFITLYGSLVLAVLWLWSEPMLIFKAFRAYSILLSLRLVCIWLLPLDPPPGMIILPDPIIQAVAHASGEPLTRDLFFSGHTSSMFLAAFVMPSAKKRWTFIVLGILVGCALIAQHVHYSIDVFVAPMAALMAVALSGRSS
ncbi:MAG: hypothetical protein J5I53_05295 [Bradyrhizobiaceae bacterium]|nr:hypothetical protein [Bradyrhizobiaceae bacterium]